MAVICQVKFGQSNSDDAVGMAGVSDRCNVSRDAVEAFGDDAIASDPEAAIGTGGMQMVSREVDVLTELERNPNYYREGLPYIDGLRANWNLDGAYRAAQYVAGETDILFCTWLGFPAENEAVRGQVGEENLVEVPMNATWHLGSFHIQTQVEPCTDPESVPPMTTSDGDTPRAEVAQQSFADIGFEVELLEQPNLEYITLQAAGEFTLAVQGLGGAFDPDALHGTHHSDGGRNFGEFSDPEIDALLERGRTTFGQENRLPIYDEIQTKLLEQHNPQIYCNWGQPVVGHRPWLKGYGPTNMQTAATYRWYRSWFEGKPGV